MVLQTKDSEMKIKYFFLTLICLTVGINAFSSQQKKIFEEEKDISSQSRSSRAASTASSQIRPYEELSLEEKYQKNLSLLKLNRKQSIEQMEKLATEEKLLNAQMFLGSYYSSGASGKSDIEKAIIFFNLAYEQDKKDAANALGIMHYVDGNFEKAEQYYKEAIGNGSIAAQKNLNDLKIEEEQ